MASLGPISKNAIDCSQIADWSREIGWDVDYQQVGRGAFNGNFRAVFCSSLRVTQQYCNLEMVARGVPPPGMMCVLTPAFSRNQAVIQGRKLGKTDAAVMEAGSEGLLKSPPRLRMSTVSVPQSQLESALWDYSRCQLSSVLSNCGVATFPERLLQDLTQVLKVVSDPTFEKSGELAHFETEEQIVHIICEALSSPEYKLDWQRRAHYVLRARDYIESNLGDILQVSQIASEVRVSVRTLQFSFREVAGVSVVEYIRTRRLSRARQYLLARPESDSPVTEAATNVGLFHLGYFSRDYKKLFGERPSQTLHRGDGG